MDWNSSGPHFGWSERVWSHRETSSSGRRWLWQSGTEFYATSLCLMSQGHISQGQTNRLMYCSVGLSPLALWVWEGELEGRKVLVWKEDYWAVLLAASQDALFTDIKSIINLHDFFFFNMLFIVHPNISVVLIAQESRDSISQGTFVFFFPVCSCHVVAESCSQVKRAKE